MCTLCGSLCHRCEFDVPPFLVRLLIATAEFSFFVVALATVPLMPSSVALLLTLTLTLLGLFALITGRGLPRLRGRLRGAVVFVLAGVFALVAFQAHVEDREERWAALRTSDPDAYLAELVTVDRERWFAELRELRPDEYEHELARREVEADRRAAEQEAARVRQCTDAKAGEAFVMIQADVRSALVAPSTAVFSRRAGPGTRHIGDCVYEVNGHFDAQNGFGAMLRGTFNGTTRYFPDAGSWQTQSLTVN